MLRLTFRIGKRHKKFQACRKNQNPVDHKTIYTTQTIVIVTITIQCAVYIFFLYNNLLCIIITYYVLEYNA